MAKPSRIQNDILEVIVVGGTNLKDVNWVFRQLPYISLTYAGNQSRTSCLTNGGKNPRFNKKLEFTVVEGFHEVAIIAWSKNFIIPDSFIGNGMIELNKVLMDGYDDVTCKILGISGKNVGEIKLIMRYSNPEKSRKASALKATPPRSPEVPRTGAHDHEPTPPLSPVAATGYPTPSSSFHPYAFHPSPTPSVPYSPSVYPPSPIPSAPFSQNGEGTTLHDPPLPSPYPPPSPPSYYYPSAPYEGSEPRKPK